MLCTLPCFTALLLHCDTWILNIDTVLYSINVLCFDIISFAETDEFKNLLGGQTSARTEYESDDSDDSMQKAIEKEYSKHLALKTNTLPMQA